MTPLRLPDFIIAGAPRCGTTWLYCLADRHPAITMAKPVAPEPKFFLRDDLFARGLEYYAKSWFADIPADNLAGEKSSNYLESAPAADRICRCLPAVRLIFVLRNPVQRAFSNYLWSRQNGLEALSFAEALDREPERDHAVPQLLRYARPHALFSRGLYADLLQPYFECIPRERILVLRFEDICYAPIEVAERLHQFLGIKARPYDALGLAPVNAARNEDAQSLDPSLYARLAERYAEANRRLGALLGAGFPLWEL